MQVELEVTGSYSRKVSITVPAGDVDHAYDHVYKEYARAAKIPGFRPGKAPRTLIEKRFRGEMAGEVQNRLVGSTLYKAFQEKEVHAVGMPKIVSADSPKKTEDYAYSVEVDVQPEIDLKNYKGLEFEVKTAEVSSSDIQEEIEKMAQQSSELVPVLDRDVVEESDVVLVDYAGTLDGVAFEGGSASDVMLDLKAGGYIPGFCEGLLGATVPGKKDVEVTFPEDYQAPNLAGHTAVFAFELKELKKNETPKIDDEFAQDVGEDSLDALEAKVRSNIETRKQRAIDDENREAVLKALVEANPFELPPVMIDEQTDRIVENTRRQMTQILGRDMAMSAGEIESIRVDTRPNAEHQVRSGLLLLEVTKRESMEVSDEDVEAEISRMAEEAGEMAARVHAMYPGPQEKDRLRYKLLDDKALEFLIAAGNASGAKKKAAKKTSTKKTAVKKETESGAAKKVASKKTTTKKASTKKTTTKKATTKKTATKKSTSKKTTTKKETSKKTTKKKASKKA